MCVIIERIVVCKDGRRLSSEHTAPCATARTAHCGVVTRKRIIEDEDEERLPLVSLSYDAGSGTLRPSMGSRSEVPFNGRTDPLPDGPLPKEEQTTDPFQFALDSMAEYLDLDPKTGLHLSKGDATTGRPTAGERAPQSLGRERILDPATASGTNFWPKPDRSSTADEPKKNPLERIREMIDRAKAEIVERERVGAEAIVRRGEGSMPPNDANMKVPATFQCTLCPKRFKRAYNLRSHLRTHTDERPFVCSVCGKAFTRPHERTRHENLHAAKNEFVCYGELLSGEQWGCGQDFESAHALAASSKRSRPRMHQGATR
ncbi:hypothetical protein BDV96DRAFT_562123 [Lophiotrema nucula]|uniref:C2H2-type domain-containing protein n=1 Tax=Lophiotrema nucula TaxID=690887 RepID=A0A6A5ZWF3_9PLEO|nr:hypothetical protein BDV96DRAFT_562123 [Lophiotrema nucula]